MDNKELFKDYEITGWQIAPKTYKFLGIAAGINLFVIIILSQFNLLQTKACDSPYVGKVCQVLDYVSMGSALAGTGTEFEDQAYDPTKIEEGDVTYIDVSGQEPPFTYPEGYFAVANPTDETALMSPNDFGFPTDNGMTPPSSNSLDAPQVLPTPNDKVANQPIPDSPFDFGDAVKTKPVKTSRFPSYKPSRPTKRPPIRNSSPSKTPPLTGDETAGNSNSANSNSSDTVAKNNSNSNTNNLKPAAGAADDSGKFNSLPLKDFGDKYGEKILKKEVDINAPFTIEVIGKLDENGKLLSGQIKSSPDSDPKMVEVAEEAIGAFSDTHLLKPLYDIIESKEKNKKPKNIKITFSQNKDNLQAIIQTETKDEASATSIQSLLSFFIKNSAAFMREGSDEAKLLNQAQLKTNGKIFIIDFLMTNDDKTQMIEKSLKNLAKKKAQSNNATAGNQSISAK